MLLVTGVIRWSLLVRNYVTGGKLAHNTLEIRLDLIMLQAEK